ncbi:hypothetical protein [Actinoplanes sp. GCM10030250]|uniref:hypothetical protein n=1 Tax=Actinoplanes sp. GCM10030250 TaxID=3273376 RepID=UPI003610AD6B
MSVRIVTEVLMVTRVDDSRQGPPGAARDKLWAQDAMAEIDLLRAKSHVICTRLGLRSTGSGGELSPESSSAVDSGEFRRRRTWLWSGREARVAAAEQAKREAQAAFDAVQKLLDLATSAAHGEIPKYRRIQSWWSGNCVEAAFRYTHNAEARLAVLYSEEETRAEVPEAARRALESLSAENPMRDVAQRLRRRGDRGDAVSTATLSKVIEAGHAAADRQRSRLRTFRNVLIIGIFVTTLLLCTLIGITAWRPNLVPLCFVQNPPPLDLTAPNVACPVKAVRLDEITQLHTVPSRLDLFIVAALGLVGGAVSAALFLRDLYLNATPYNVSIPITLLKLPAGALTGLVGIILLAGEFVPGFSAIDKPIQILAYAIVFGFAQQVFTQFLDQRAQSLVNSVATKARVLPDPGSGRTNPSDGA